VTGGWRPTLGALPGSGGTTFRVWAPAAARVDLALESSGRAADRRAMRRDAQGYFTVTCADVAPGRRYRYAIDDRGVFPDPASRWQPEGVHGPSAVVDAQAFAWTDRQWRGPRLDETVLYELHVGTFTPAGTFAGAIERLPELRDLGVTAIELMPVADFPGARNWGYDGAALFAPARAYGQPDDLRRLVDRAHALGLAVWLDVVYNHAAPDGAYLVVFSPYYFTNRHPSPWGAGVNLDGPEHEHVRAFLIENVLHWVHEYRFDGLRLDATHAMHDDSPRPFLAELTDRVRSSAPDRGILIAAEDHRNLSSLVRPVTAGGCGLDAVWADDFHHVLRRCLAGDADGYFKDFQGTADEIVRTIRQGWLYTGEQSAHFGGPRGTGTAGIDATRFVVCLQNHDQIGNRALGGRLHHDIDLAAYRAASLLLLTVPETPLLFMGQEWAATTPFLYFTDHEPALGARVTEGRRHEFAAFAAFADPARRAEIPDPQDVTTFLRSRLPWDELTQEPHASIRRLYAAALALRRREAALRSGDRARFDAIALDAATVAVVRRDAAGGSLAILARLSGSGEVSLASIRPDAGSAWSCLMTTEEALFAPDPAPPAVFQSGGSWRVRFARPSAVVLAARPGEPEVAER
jgi:maltooligosyltrehalose trehalohydrolase